MEQARLIIAIVLSALIFLLWQFFFTDKNAVQKSTKKTEQPPAKAEQIKEAEPFQKETKVADLEKATVTPTDAETPERIPQTITVDAPLYRVVISEKGAGFVRFVLKKYWETVQKDSPLKELLPETDSFESVLLGFADKSLAGLDNAVFSTNLNSNTVNIRDGLRNTRPTGSPLSSLEGHIFHQDGAAE